MLFLCLFPSLLRNSGNKHKNDPLVSPETVRHSGTYIILYVFVGIMEKILWYKEVWLYHKWIARVCFNIKMLSYEHRHSHYKDKTSHYCLILKRTVFKLGWGRRNSSALAMELCLSCTNQSIWWNAQPQITRMFAFSGLFSVKMPFCIGYIFFYATYF